MNGIFSVLAGILAVWWLIWMFIAAGKRSVTMVVFLAGTLGLWGTLEWFLLQQENVLGYILLIIPLILLPPMVRIINAYERGILFRLGLLKPVMTPGLNIVFPLGIDWVRKVDMRTFTIDVPKQEVITRDNVPVQVDAVVYFNVFDPVLAVTNVENYVNSTSLMGQTILRSVLGQYDLDDMLGKRGELNTLLKKLLDEATDPWGVKVTAVEIKAVELAEGMKRAMAKQAEAERERRAKIIAAEGELQASEKLAQAAGVMATQPSALQLRYLQTLSEIAVEQNSTILFPLPMEILKFFDTQGRKA